MKPVQLLWKPHCKRNHNDSIESIIEENVIQNTNDTIVVSPVIPIDESVVLGKRFLTDFFPFRDEIHAEKYICIDTETDNYTIFDDENSIEEYAASLGISQNWTKIKFDKKVNN